MASLSTDASSSEEMTLPLDAGWYSPSDSPPDAAAVASGGGGRCDPGRTAPKDGVPIAGLLGCRELAERLALAGRLGFGDFKSGQAGGWEGLPAAECVVPCANRLLRVLRLAAVVPQSEGPMSCGGAAPPKAAASVAASSPAASRPGSAASEGVQGSPMALSAPQVLLAPLVKRGAEGAPDGLLLPETIVASRIHGSAGVFSWQKTEFSFRLKARESFWLPLDTDLWQGLR